MRKLLLQTTIEGDPDDWNIDRFGRLRAFLSGLKDTSGRPIFEVTARNRTRRGEPDPVLSNLPASDFNQLWLFAVDNGDGLTAQDCEGIRQFRQLGGALMVTRDHMDLGSSICSLGPIGEAHHFHSRNCEPDEGRHRVDNPFAPGISWPNYHSGANGDFQQVWAVGAIHPVMRDRLSESGVIPYLPSHPHEGAVSAPRGDPNSRVIVEGRSAITGRRFNIAIAFEQSSEGGRALAQSTFHHFADYNWDTSLGSPSFVSESPGNGMSTFPDALRSTKQYVLNVACWLAGMEHHELDRTSAPDG
jgi:hypothetical protein